MISLRSALYKIKTIHDEDMREDMCSNDDLVDWDEYHRNQLDNDNSDCGGDDSYVIQTKNSEDTQITFTASDEEHGVEVRCFEEETDGHSPTSRRSNQSSIATNDVFNDGDGVNSFNSELELLTPSPKMNGRGGSPRSFHFNYHHKALPSPQASAPSLDEGYRSPPKKQSSLAKERALKLKSSKKDTRHI